MSSFLLKKKRLKTWDEKLSNKSQRTKDGYASVIKSFEKFCSEYYGGRTKDDIFDELSVLKDAEKTLATVDLIQNWINWHYSHGVKTSVVKLYLAWLGKYFDYREIPITQKIKDELDFKRDLKDEPFALEIKHIQNIFKFASPKKIGFYLALVSTGARPAELLQVKKRDIITSTKRLKVLIQPEGVKTRHGRSAYLTKEAARYCLMRLRQISDDDLVWGKHEDYNKTEKAESKTFSRYCDNAGYVERYHSNNYRKITLYSFRSFFFSAAADVNREGYAHKMTGHGGYLPQYDRMSDEKKLEWFLKVEPFLTIDDDERLQLENEQLKKENTEKKQFEEEIKELKKKQETLEYGLKEYESIKPNLDKLVLNHIEELGEDFFKKVFSKESA
ncbi:integrase family protein [Marine Group I thaumarchaeote SCGC AAA799-E16]|uniref:Integrase family protein n=1 Tax=Marine Group I thaumarchaeote SCGC AAA799-E16 TaxID=1502292 RepID=A0A081S454_9ARCH|nr:integrase family protein [Marine Group I thaumarchaeote SCGC AAA799-E16]